MANGVSDQQVALAKADALVKQGSFAEAIQILHILVDADPQNGQIISALGTTQFKAGQFDAAAQAFARAFAVTQDPRQLNYQGFALRKLGRKAEAESCYRQAIALAPNDPTPKANLAILIADEKPQDALKMLDEFYRELPSIEFLIPIITLTFLQNDFLNSGLTLLKISKDHRSQTNIPAGQQHVIFWNGAISAWKSMLYWETLALRQEAWASRPIQWQRAHPEQDCPSPVPPLRYSREDPSPRYHILSEQYGLMHTNAAQSTEKVSDFAGTRMNFFYAPLIKEYLQAHGATSLLDYGGGRGMQYKSVTQPNGTVFGGLGQYYGVEHAASFDAGWPVECPYPAGQTFDAIVSCDVLEHIDEADLPWVVDELFTFARKAIFVAIGSYPARKILPNGENAHCTIKPSSWWRPIFAAAARRHPGIHYRVLNVTNNTCTEMDGFEGVG